MKVFSFIEPKTYEEDLNETDWTAQIGRIIKQFPETWSNTRDFASFLDVRRNFEASSFNYRDSNSFLLFLYVPVDVLSKVLLYVQMRLKQFFLYSGSLVSAWLSHFLLCSIFVV